MLTPQRLELRALGEKKQGPVYASLCDADIRRRIQGGRRQPLARACGLHRHGPQRVMDATAGLGRDAMVLAALGCEMTLLERSPIVAALLYDGLQRAYADQTLGQMATRQIRMRHADAQDFMQQAGDAAYDVIYLDPMYPHSRKQALAKKEMRILRAVAGEDDDAADLLTLALKCAAQRVVVKRPPHADPLAGQEPDHALTGNRVRYDVYFTRKLGTRKLGTRELSPAQATTA